MWLLLTLVGMVLIFFSRVEAASIGQPAPELTNTVWINSAPLQLADLRGKVILFGLYIAGWLPLPFLMREKHFNLKEHPSGHLGAFLVGVTFAAAWIPCVGPILGSILVLASTSETAGQGILLLVAYSAGLAIPFLLSALLFGRFLLFFNRFKRFLPWMSRVSGLFLILVGVLLLTDYFTLLSTFALRFTPEWLFERL